MLLTDQRATENLNVTAHPDAFARSVLAELASHPPVTTRPGATYRLQLSPSGGFEAVAALAPYLNRLGITHAYLAPVFQARAGTTHGYDVHDLGEISQELGGEAAFRRMAATLHDCNLSILQDIVPNHMGICGGNPYWTDVLENGPSSTYAAFFDIDWQPPCATLKNRVLLPFLGDQYGRELERGELKLQFDRGGFVVSYHEHTFPIQPGQYLEILRPRVEQLETELGPDHPHLAELLSVMTQLGHLPEPCDQEPRRVVERQREKEVVKRRLSSLTDNCAAIHLHVQTNLDRLNQDVDALDRLLSAQMYRLAHWRVAGEEINYRRFFDINELAAVRIEDRPVFEHQHRLLFQLLDSGVVSGLRIDHPDGLYNPTEYFLRLQEEHVIRACQHKLYGDSDDPDFAALLPHLRQAYRSRPLDTLRRPLYVVVEKILAGDEPMPTPWAVDGTTGYDFLNAVNGLFVNGRYQKVWSALYGRAIGSRRPLAELLHDCKKLVMAGAMATEMNLLAHRLQAIAHMNRRTRDFTLNSLRSALSEYIAGLQVYRTFIGDADERVSVRDRSYILDALRRARLRAMLLDNSIFDFLQSILLLQQAPGMTSEEDTARRIFVMKLQQLTGAFTAKALEDTAFYIYNRLGSLCEVGGDPARFGWTAGEFHALNQRRLACWPGSMSATTTHDTKRSEDVRARLNAVSERPHEFATQFALWRRAHRRSRRRVNGQLAPSRNEMWLLYQTLLGTRPRDGHVDDTYRNRLREYLRKALREAKVNSSWNRPDTAWEDACLDFVDGVLREPREPEGERTFRESIARDGLYNSLAQVVLKIFSPGVPDIYQGTELWDDSLVDPDNRRPVDFALRVRLLEEQDQALMRGPQAELASRLLQSLSDPTDPGRIKLYTVALGLRARAQDENLFAHGTYLPLVPSGEQSEHVCAFARVGDGRIAMVAVPRLLSGRVADDGRLLQEAWEGCDLRIELPQSVQLRHVYTGETFSRSAGVASFSAADLFGKFPVAVLIGGMGT